MTPATAPTDREALGAVEALADPLRRDIVARLATEALCTCHLVEMTGAPQPTVSYHLKVLREAGWVEPEPAGRYTYYRLRPEAVGALASALADLAERAGRGQERRRPCG